MWPTEGCKILAPPEPASKCGWDVKPEPRAIERADLYCDTIIWQFKEMGASDPFMAQCPNAPKMPVEKEEEKEQEEEKEPQEEPEEPEDAEEPKAKAPATKSGFCPHDESCNPCQNLLSQTKIFSIFDKDQNAY